MWVMAALKSSDITSEVVDPVAKFGSSIWDLMKKMPTYAPIFPGWVSAQGLQRVWSMPINALEKRVADQIAPFQKGVDSMFWVSTIPQTSITDVKNLLRDWVTTAELWDLQRKLRSIAEQYWTNSSQFKSLIDDVNNSMKSSSDPTIKWLSKNWPLYDWQWKLTLEWVELLWNNNLNKDFWKSQFDKKWQEKILNWWAVWASPETPTSSTLPSTIKPPEKLWDKNTFNIYAYNKDWKQEWSKIELTVQDWKATSWDSDIKNALSSYYKNMTPSELEEVLKQMWIKDKEEIKRIFALLK